MTAIGKVSLKGIVHDDFQYAFNLKSGDHEADDSDDDTARGGTAGVAAVSLDTAAANQVKLAGDGERILGRAEVVEDRTVEGILVGTISLQGGIKYLVNPDASTSSPDERPAVGDFIVGAADDNGVQGYVRKATTAELALGTRANWLVVEADDAHTYVIAIRV